MLLEENTCSWFGCCSKEALMLIVHLQLTEKDKRDERFVGNFPRRLISVSNSPQEREPFSPLSAAAFAGHEEIVQLLLSPQFRLSRSSYYFSRPPPLQPKVVI